MKNKNILIGILAITLVFTMMAVGCGEDPTDDNGGNGSGSGGTLTLTNIPSEYNGKYAIYTESRSTPSAIGLYGCQSINVSTGITITAVQISNGSVSLPMWVQGNGGFTRYSGNHTVGDSRNSVTILNTATFSSGENNVLTGKYFQSITFSKGSATISWNNAGGNGGGGGGSDVLNGTTWRATNSEGYYIVVTFNSPNWSMEDNTNNGQIATHTGTYTVSGNTVTLTILTFNGSPSSGTQTATISGNIISLAGWPTFTKQ